MRRICLALVALSLVIAIGCKKSDSPPSGAAPAAAPPMTSVAANQNQNSPANAASGQTGKLDACHLLSSSEIQSVQGEAVVDTKLSSASERGASVSQCFFTLPTFANSISLAVTTRGEGKDARDPKAVWNDTFREEGRNQNDRNERSASRGEEEEERSAPRQKVPGLGQEAFWMGSRVGGALYVLKGNTFFRISVGGAEDQASKLRKSKMLAEKILARM